MGLGVCSTYKTQALPPIGQGNVKRDGVGPWLSHLMFYAPKTDGAKDGASWGADLPSSPVILDTSHRVVPEPETIFMVPVAHWSDATAAPPT